MPEKEMAFLERVKAIEQDMFGTKLDTASSKRMKDDGGYSWLYRPSHHIKTGLMKEEDINMLQKGTLLSIGSAHATLEKVLLKLGAPMRHITISDVQPIPSECTGGMQTYEFDCTETWPMQNEYDVIIFPESLCIALRDRMRGEGYEQNNRSLWDRRESELLCHVLSEALQHLRCGGELRCNGPMSHPTVVQMAEEKLKEIQKRKYALTYERYFLRVRRES